MLQSVLIAVGGNALIRAGERGDCLLYTSISYTALLTAEVTKTLPLASTAMPLG